ncbi:MAG: helix-turn-helix domain-containing protein [Gemmatimonadaceae bacterium]
MPVPRRSPFTILLSDEEREHLAAVAARYTAPYFEVVRAKIVLYAAEGLANHDIAQRLDLPRRIVSKWRKRFYKKRLPGLVDAPRSGRPPDFSPSRRRRRQSARL